MGTGKEAAVVAFVLSGGGNRGALQVGALQALLEHGVEPHILVGTSAGALNAVYLAARPGLSGVAELSLAWATWAQANVYPGNRVAALWRLVRGCESLYPNTNVRRFVEAHTPAGVRCFGDIRGVQLYVVAAHLETGELRLFGEDPGDLLLDAPRPLPFWDFSHAAELVEAGYHRTVAYLEDQPSFELRHGALRAGHRFRVRNWLQGSCARLLTRLGGPDNSPGSTTLVERGI
ncbi:MAG: patatin-like phospholipase family protein [Ardenticatenaceae bacterium]|nr:patatin-like phospholipase family protein [Ardenticatenaceae bacterium]